MSNAARLAEILKRLGDAHYQAADELIALAEEQPQSPSAVMPAAGSARPAPADDLPPLETRDQLFSQCPNHQQPWTVKEGGISKNGKPYKAFWKCNGKNSDGSFCNKKPDPSWVRGHDPEQALLRGAA
jgi:hypothetical protein